MKTINGLVFGSLIGLLFFSCQPLASVVQCVIPEGRYNNATVLEKCPGLMPADVPHFSFQMQFIGKDSILMDNGFEKFILQYAKEETGCNYRIKSASLFGDMIFTTQPDSSILLYDTAWTKISTPSRFEPLKGTGLQSSRFEERLNECMIAGAYRVTYEKKTNDKSDFVEILRNGQIKGIQKFIGYKLCYAGDCLEETNPPARTIDLIDESGQMQTFVFKPTDDNLSIEFYSIGDPIPDIKGERPIGKKEFTLSRN